MLKLTTWKNLTLLRVLRESGRKSTRVITTNWGNLWNLRSLLMSYIYQLLCMPFLALYRAVKRKVFYNPLLGFIDLLLCHTNQTVLIHQRFLQVPRLPDFEGFEQCLSRQKSTIVILVCDFDPIDKSLHWKPWLLLIRAF